MNKGKGKKVTGSARKKMDKAMDRLFAAVKECIELKGGTVLLAGPTETMHFLGQPEGKWVFAIHIVGKRPPIEGQKKLGAGNPVGDKGDGNGSGNA